MSLDIDSYLQFEKDRLLNHPLFEAIHTLQDVRLLMESHVFAVWDFMTLLKRIQRDLTCIDLPWTPPRHIIAARLINEIVVGEETDQDPTGEVCSHFDLYLQAMEDVGADTGPIRRFLGALQAGVPVQQALVNPEIPAPARLFVAQTLDIALYGSTEQALAYFFFGREDIIPDMFTGLLQRWGLDEAQVPRLTYYLKRHIELDGDDHGPAAKRIIAQMVTDSAQQAQMVGSAKSALNARIELWHGVHQLLLIQAKAPEPALACS